MGKIKETTGRAAAPAAAPPTALAIPEAPPPAVVMQQARAAYEHTMEAKMAYVRLLAASNLLPKSYQKQPANVLFALEYGETLGITPIAAMMGIHVIDGKPSAGSGLISGLVQAKGHRLRVEGNDQRATCRINRADDPGYTFEFTWTMDRARQAGLTGKQVWKNYPAAMLMARAITECARAACQDVLYGLGYTPEELGADSLDGTDWIPPEVTETATAAPGEPAATREQILEVNRHLERLEAEDKLGACAIIADREHLVSAADLTGDEADHIIAELEGCEDRAALEALLAETREARG